MNSNNDKAIDRIEAAIKDLKDNNFTLYFFVVDSKNVPTGSLTYIYQMAKTLYDKGYKVTMLYQLENEYTKAELHKLRKKEAVIDDNKVFTGVGDWMGQEYAALPHMNIAIEQWKVGPSDFLFIPEAFSSLMFQTYKYKAPCKRFVILQNFDYVTDTIPFGAEWKNYGIYDAIANCDRQADLIKEVFPYMNTIVVNPYIPQYFRKPIKPQKLIVNIVAKKETDVNKIIKPFYWKYPILKFVPFRDLRKFPRERFAELFQEGAITIWVDEDSSFGYSALEAMRCNNIVIGKIPNLVPEWMEQDGSIASNGFWVYDIKDIPDILSKVIASWMRNKVPAKIYEAMEETNKLYTEDEWEKNIEETFSNMVNGQIKNFEEVKQNIMNKKTDNE